MATTYLVSKITNAIEQIETTLGIFLDLSKAFDTINHDILLTKRLHYGIRGQVLKWFKSYLSNRKQHTEFCGEISTSQNATMYADDTSIFIQHKNINSTFKYAQMEVNSVAHWLSANKLSLNIDKTKYILFHSNRNKLSRCSQSIFLKYKPLLRVKDIHFLGVHLNETLSWKSRMLAILKKIRMNAAIIHKLKYYLNTTNLASIYHSLITSHLRYCITTLNHGNQTIVQRM